MPISHQTAENEYKKNPDITKEEIAILKAWTLEQNHLPEVSEFELIVFYHSCYSDMDMTKTTIEKYYTMKTAQKYFTERDPSSEKLTYTLDRMLFALLPKRTKEGYQVLYVRFLDTEPSHFHYDDTVKAFFMVHELLHVEDGTNPGLLVMADLEGVPFGLIGRLGLRSLHDSFAFLQEALPVRLKGFHILNAPTFIAKFIAFLKPFIVKELMDLIHLHPAPIDTVFDFLSKDGFPSDMGGEFDTFEKIKNDVKNRLKDNSEYFIKEEQAKRVDESKRAKSDSVMSKLFNKIW